MHELTVILTIRCSPADLETLDRLREDRSRGAFLRRLLRQAGKEGAPCA